MTDSNDEQVYRAIRDAARGQQLGDKEGAQCPACYGNIADGDRARAYAVGPPTRPDWFLVAILHADCWGEFVSAAEGRLVDQMGAVVDGILVHDPTISAGDNDEPRTAEKDGVSVFEMPRGEYVLQEPEVWQLTPPGEGL
jgi:hypothetical protein